VSRVVCWFSCGAASAVATKLTLADHPDAVVAYTDPGSEHPDNERFLADCERWFGTTIVRLKSTKYVDTWDVWKKRRYLVGPSGALCTVELKKRLRQQFEDPTDVQVFGYTTEEAGRVARFRKANPDVNLSVPLLDRGLSKDDCLALVERAGIELPAMYRLGYRNANCIGCPHGGFGYWNKIRRDFPETFDRMAAVERELGRTCNRDKSGPVFLDELDPNRGNHADEPSFECSLLCVATEGELTPNPPEVAVTLATKIAVKHPARFSQAIIERFTTLLEADEIVHDPFAGTGERLGHLADALDLHFTGTEIERAFIVDPRVKQGDSRLMTTYPWPLIYRAPFTIVTSPVYANGMADNFKPTGVCSTCEGGGSVAGERCPPCAGSGQRIINRKTYRNALIEATGDPDVLLQPGNMGAHSYRAGRKAADRYWDIANAVIAQWGPAGATRALVNVSDFVKAGETVPHVFEWVNALTDAGWRIERLHAVETPRMGNGANRDARAPYEAIIEARWPLAPRELRRLEAKTP
jgi:3'-phosphoadenosine 5'-phosphosulfate sulfotransferase (PAPS reductase)/FAD synthetase